MTTSEIIPFGIGTCLIIRHTETGPWEDYGTITRFVIWPDGTLAAEVEHGVFKLS